MVEQFCNLHITDYVGHITTHGADYYSEPTFKRNYWFWNRVWYRDYRADSPTICNLTYEQGWFSTYSFEAYWTQYITSYYHYWQNYLIKFSQFPHTPIVSSVKSYPEFPFLNTMSPDATFPLFKGFDLILKQEPTYRGSIFKAIVHKYMEESKTPEFAENMQHRINQEYERRLAVIEKASELKLGCSELKLDSSDSNFVSHTHSNPYKIDWLNYIKDYYFGIKDYISEFKIIKFIMNTGIIEFFINHFYYFLGFGLTITISSALFILFIDKLYTSEDIKKIEQENKKNCSV